MTATKDEVIFSRVANLASGEVQLMVSYPLSITESEANRLVASDVDLQACERTEKKQSHWLDKLAGDPGRRYVFYKHKEEHQ